MGRNEKLLWRHPYGNKIRNGQTQQLTFLLSDWEISGVGSDFTMYSRSTAVMRGCVVGLSLTK